MKLPGFVGGSYLSQSAMLAGERTVNFYPEIIDTPFAKAQAALFPCPGLPDFATIQDSPGRAIFAEDELLTVVFGTTVYDVASDGTATARGVVLTDDNPATIAANGSDERFITSGTRGYILDMNTHALTHVVSDVTMGGHIDTFFIGLDSLTGTLKISEAADGTTWDPTQVAQRSSSSDKWISMLISRNEIFLMGAKTGEVWGNTGAAPMPFEKRGGSSFEVGIEAPFSAALLRESPAFLGRSQGGSSGVYWMNGYSPIRISNHAIEWQIQQYKEAGQTIGDAVGWSYEMTGHAFYVLEFPSVGKTWVYDAVTGMWHERGRWSSAANDFVPYRARFHAEVFDKNLVCDSYSGKIYRLSTLVYTDINGGELRRVRRTPHIGAENTRIYYDYFELEAQRGVGLPAGQGSDPLIMMRYSNDGGYSWSNERTESLGRIGSYSQRIRWNRCGSGRDRVWEVACSDPVPVRLFDAYVGMS